MNRTDIAVKVLAVVEGIILIIVAIFGIVEKNTPYVITVNGGEKISISKNDVQKKYQEIENQNQQLEQEVALLQDNTGDLESKNTELESKNSELEGKITELESENSELKVKKSEVEKQLANQNQNSSQIPPNQSDNNSPTEKYLNDIVPPYQTGDFRVYTTLSGGDNKTVQIAGKTYHNACVFASYYGECFALYNLDKNYKTVKGILGHIDGTREVNSTLRIYLDGKLDREISINWDDIPKNLEIDVSGITQLRFSLVDAQNAGYAIVEPTIE